VTAPGPRTPYAEHRLDLGESRLRKLLRLLAGEPRGRVLDVGCAGGELAEILHARGWRVDGVEREPELVRTAERHGIAVRLSDFDREPLPWDTATFDAAVAGEVIEHVVDTDHLLGELARVVRPGGALGSGFSSVDTRCGWTTGSSAPATCATTRRACSGTTWRSTAFAWRHTSVTGCRFCPSAGSTTGGGGGWRSPATGGRRSPWTS